METYRTDKVGHGYLPFYQELAGRYPGGRLLEIGTSHGDGLEMYRGLGFDVYGIELLPDRAKIARGRGFIVMEGKAAELAQDPRVWGGYDVIVDDASHEFGETIATFWHWWGHLNVGGIYVIEDWSHLGAENTQAFRNWAVGMCIGLVGPVYIDQRGLISLTKMTADSVTT